jgi:transposase
MPRRKEIVRHLTEDEIDERIATSDDPTMVRRLCFLKNVYAGDTLTAAADRVGASQPTGVRWADRWNEGGLEGLRPDTPGGRPSKLDDDQRRQLAALLEDGTYSRPADITRLIADEFGVEYSEKYVYELVRSLDVDSPIHGENSSQR